MLCEAWILPFDENDYIYAIGHWFFFPTIPQNSDIDYEIRHLECATWYIVVKWYKLQETMPSFIRITEP